MIIPANLKSKRYCYGWRDVHEHRRTGNHRRSTIVRTETLRTPIQQPSISQSTNRLPWLLFGPSCGLLVSPDASSRPPALAAPVS